MSLREKIYELTRTTGEKLNAIRNWTLTEISELNQTIGELAALIPTNNNELDNGAGYITSAEISDLSVQNNKVRILKVNKNLLESEDEIGLSKYFNSLPQSEWVEVADDEIVIIELEDIPLEPINPHFESEWNSFVVTLNLLDENGDKPTNLKVAELNGDGLYVENMIYKSQWPEGSTTNMAHVLGGSNEKTLGYYFDDGDGNVIWNFVELTFEGYEEGDTVDVVLDLDPSLGYVVDFRAINPEDSENEGYELREFNIVDNTGETVITENQYNTHVVVIETSTGNIEAGWEVGTPVRFWVYVPINEDLTIDIDYKGGMTTFNIPIPQSDLESGGLITIED